MQREDRILIVAAHPDDEVLGCGGTIARFAQAGAAVRVVFLAEGITARYRPDQHNDPDVIKQSKQRNDAAFKANAILGVAPDQVFVEQRPCCRLDQVPLLDLVHQIEQHIDSFKPTILFTHSNCDTNIDHVIAHRAVLAAARPTGREPLKALYAFEVLSSTEWNPLAPFPGQVFIDISATIDLKVRALVAYGNEMREPPHPRSEEVIRSLARFRGAAAGLHFAESFQLVRGIYR
ncbi:MAG: PIG-L deacetylase family protein [Ferrovibrio sp.]